MAFQHCPQCDATRSAEGRTEQIGKPCDICDGHGIDYLGRRCRHCYFDGCVS